MENRSLAREKIERLLNRPDAALAFVKPSLLSDNTPAFRSTFLH
jgi:hypothetical protein